MPQRARPIRSIEELVSALRAGPGKKGYWEIMVRVAISSEQFEPYCTWNKKHYTRNCILRTEDFELLLICYEPGQRTSIHDYATQEAWIKPILGTIIEERFELGPDGLLRKVSSAKLDGSSFSYLHNGRSIHRYLNTNNERSITLNLYAKPLIKWKVYDESSGETRSQVAGEP